MGPTVAIWPKPQSNAPVIEDLVQIAHRLDSQARSADNFHITNTAVIGGTTRVNEPRPFGLALGPPGLDESELRTTETLLGFTPPRTVDAFAYANAEIDHRILGELALFLARQFDGLVDFGGTLGSIHAAHGTLYAIPYEGSTLAETFHVGNTEFLEWWLQQAEFHMVK
jgi:hypothetical protein